MDIVLLLPKRDPKGRIAAENGGASGVLVAHGTAYDELYSWIKSSLGVNYPACFIAGTVGCTPSTIDVLEAVDAAIAPRQPGHDGGVGPTHLIREVLQ